MNPTSTRLGGATMETQPSVDAIQEIAIQTSNFAAEFGTWIIPSGTIFNPTDFTIVNGVTVRNPFVGNKIPLASFDPVAAKILGAKPAWSERRTGGGQLSGACRSEPNVQYPLVQTRSTRGLQVALVILLPAD